MSKVPEYVRLGRKTSFAKSVMSYLKNRDLSTKIREHCFDKALALSILEDFANTHKYGILPDKLVCYRIFVDVEEDQGELGLTYVPVYRCWEFYAKGLNKHSRPVYNFKVHLEEHGFKLKLI